MKAALLPLLLLGACVPEETNPDFRAGYACWVQHGDYTVCYAKCAAMNPRYHISAGLCVQGVDAAGSNKEQAKP